MYLLTLYQPGVRAIHAIDVGKWSWSPFVILRCGWWKRRSPMDLSPIRLGLSQSLSTSPFWQESRQVAYCNATRARSSDGLEKLSFYFYLYVPGLGWNVNKAFSLGRSFWWAFIKSVSEHQYPISFGITLSSVLTERDQSTDDVCVFVISWIFTVS